MTDAPTPPAAPEPGAIDATAHTPLQADTVIVGAGIAGASVAWHLAQLGQAGRVLLLERESQPGRHSTGRSAAMFMESYGPPQVRALTRASRAFYRAPPAGFLGDDAAPGAGVLTPRGELYVATPGQEALLQSTWDELSPALPGLRRLDTAQTLALVPVLRPEAVAAALYSDAAMDIDVHALHQGYLRGFRRAGGRVHCDAEVVSAQAAAGGAQPRSDRPRWTLNLSDGRQVLARVVVNAAGAWADALAQHLGAPPIGLQPCRRSAFTFDAPHGLDVTRWPAVVGIDESWYFKPDAGRLLGSPANADPTVPHDVVPEELDIAIGIDRITTATTLQIRRPSSTWAGLRSFVADGELVIGADPACPGLFWVAAQGGYGIQSGHGAGWLAASLIGGQALPAALAEQGVDPAAVSPARLRAA